MTLTDGTYAASGNTQWGGMIQVNPGISSLSSGTFDPANLNVPTSQLDGTLLANASPLIVSSGVTFAGPGVLKNLSDMILTDGTTLDVTVHNEGDLHIDAAFAGHTTVGEFAQLAPGAIFMGLAGTSSHDLLDVTGAAMLDGTLNVEFEGGFMPGRWRFLCHSDGRQPHRRDVLPRPIFPLWAAV